MLSFKPTFSLSCFTFIKRLFSSSLSAIKVVSSSYLRLLNLHTIQQSHCWAYTQRKPELKETHAPQCSLQHCLQQPGHGSNLNVHQQLNAKGSCGTYTMEYYSAIKKNTFESLLMRWMKLEPIIQSEVSQKGNTNTVY